MLDQLISFVQTLDNKTIYMFLFAIAYLENVIPPIPGDMPVAFVGSFIAFKDLSFIGCVFWASLGSVLGFFTMYAIGRYVGDAFYGVNERLLGSRIGGLARKIFPPEHFNDVRAQFAKYGYGLILANRFLTGSRSIISIAAGASSLNVFYVHLCAFISAILWNILLVYGGYFLGENWSMLGDYIATYGAVLTILVVAAFAILVYRYIKQKRTAETGRPSS